MTYKLEFHAAALKEWRKLGATVKEQFKKKLVERLETPHVAGDRIAPNRYKIKLKASGYRLVYEVIDERVMVYVLAIDKRERLAAYVKAEGRA